MSGRGSRVKGAAAERELFGKLNNELGHEWFKRNLLQTRQGGCDDQNAEVFALEVKRQEKQALHQWIDQTLEQAKPGQLPVLAYRRNHEDWKLLVVLDISGFCKLFKRLCGLDAAAAPVGIEDAHSGPEYGDGPEFDGWATRSTSK